MARKLEHGDSVRILGGMAEFIGQTGYILGEKGTMLRVRMDRPVHVEGVGEITSDLWERRFLRKLRG